MRDTKRRRERQCFEFDFRLQAERIHRIAGITGFFPKSCFDSVFNSFPDPCPVRLFNDSPPLPRNRHLQAVRTGRALGRR
jgi:hypothetical protein